MEMIEYRWIRRSPRLGKCLCAMFHRLHRAFSYLRRVSRIQVLSEARGSKRCEVIEAKLVLQRIGNGDARLTCADDDKCPVLPF